MNLKNQADMHQSANALRAAIYGAPMVPNASIDRHSPGGAIKGGQAVEDDVGSMDHLQGCVRGRMLRLGQMTLMFFAATRGAIDSEGNESAKRTDE
jgi:hypothetical protein